MQDIDVQGGMTYLPFTLAAQCTRVPLVVLHTTVPLPLLAWRARLRPFPLHSSAFSAPCLNWGLEDWLATITTTEGGGGE